MIKTEKDKDMILEGTAWKFGDNVDTDVIIPARFLNVSDAEELGHHCFEDLRPGFEGLVKSGDIIVAGKNFGCGSSREHAPLAIKAAGINLVIAASFARIFYRNSFNIGLPLLECPEGSFDQGERLKANLKTGEITDVSKEKSFQAKPLPDFMNAILDAGGLVALVKAKGIL